MSNYLLLVIGMALVTYIPRLIPLIALSDKNISGKAKNILSYIPYASLSILITRGILTASSDMTIATIAGVVTAGVIASVKESMVLSMIGGVFVAYLILK